MKSPANLLHFERAELPVVVQRDVVVVGGSLAGVSAALTIIARGKSVALVEPRTYLGSEIAATLRAWLSTESPPTDSLWRDLLQHCAAEPRNGEIPLRLNDLKKRLEDLLLAADVHLLYTSQPVGWHSVDGRLAGVIVGNKSGRQVVGGDVVVDAREMVGKSADSIVIEFDGVGTLNETQISVPHGNVTLHAGVHGNGHWFAELVSDPNNRVSVRKSVFEDTNNYLQLRQRAFETATHLIQTYPTFAKATLATIGYAAWECGHPARTLRPRWSSSQEGVWQLVGAEPAAAPQHGQAFGRWLVDHWSEVLETELGESSIPSADNAPIIKTLTTPSPSRKVCVNNRPLPVLGQTDVLVVGGGSSGAMAAISAAREGAETLLIDFNPALGGTGTYGGVHSYWFGRRMGFSAEITAHTADLQAQLNEPPPSGNVPRWNIEAKIQAWLNCAREAGVQLLLNASVFGAVLDGERVCGVAVTTADGVGIVEARVVIDATGDGDVAAHAGADFVYGSERDHTVMWYSLAQFPRPGRTRNNFTSMADVGDSADYTRAILAGRRRERQRCYEHGIYIAPRETRHIRGGVTLTLTDQLLRRAWPDVVNITFSNHDVKGHSDSDWLKVGLIPPNLEVEIPYRALVPNGLDGLLIVGKAISAAHDALPAIRMQADIENLGGVVGIAAALAVRDDVLPQHLNVRQLQERLVQVAVLPADILTRQLAAWQPEIPALIDALAHDRVWHSYSDMRMDEVFAERIPLVDLCCAGEGGIGALEGAIGRYDSQTDLRLAMALSLVGSAQGVPILLPAIHAELADGQLPERDSHILYAGTPPDQGAMPQLIYWLYALALTGNERMLPVLQRVVELLDGISAEDVANGRKGIFHYVETICLAAERLGNRAAIPLLCQLHSYVPFRKLVCRQGYEVDYMTERRAYLELLIGRALARCGSPDGYVILIDYLTDVRALLAAHAHSELRRITGCDFGRSSAAWLAWLEAHANELTPVAWRPQTAAMLAWAEEIEVISGQ